MCAQFLRNINKQKNITLLTKYLFLLICTYKYCFFRKISAFCKLYYFCSI